MRGHGELGVATVEDRVGRQPETLHPAARRCLASSPWFCTVVGTDIELPATTLAGGVSAVTTRSALVTVNGATSPLLLSLLSGMLL
ncbi:MAG: hypothetical protein U0802_20895 [Candidatus Binatia bacterium]